MTADQIHKRIKKQADAQLPEVIEQLLPIVRNHHARDAWRAECSCSYCQYIRHTYVPAKLQVHQLKKRIRYLEGAMNDVDIHATWAAEQRLALQQMKLWKMQQEKNQLKEGK